MKRAEMTNAFQPLSLFVSLYAISQYTLLVYTTSVSSYILLGHAMLICPWSSGYDRVPHWPIYRDFASPVTYVSRQFIRMHSMTCKFLFKDHIKIISVVQYWRIKMQIFVHFLYILRPLEENNLNVKSNYHLCHYAEKKPK